jgi:hypothetical protein
MIVIAERQVQVDLRLAQRQEQPGQVPVITGLPIPQWHLSRCYQLLSRPLDHSTHRSYLG